MSSTGTDELGRVKPGTDAALKLLLSVPGSVDVESARKWLRDALACLEDPIDAVGVGNAENQAAKALVALGRSDVWFAERTPKPADPDVYEPMRPAEFETDSEWAGACLERSWIAEDRAAAAEFALENVERSVAEWRTEKEA